MIPVPEKIVRETETDRVELNCQESISGSSKIETDLNKRRFYDSEDNIWVNWVSVSDQMGSESVKILKLSFFNLRFDKENFGFCSRLNPTPK